MRCAIICAIDRRRERHFDVLLFLGAQQVHLAAVEIGDDLSPSVTIFCLLPGSSRCDCE